MGTARFSLSLVLSTALAGCSLFWAKPRAPTLAEQKATVEKLRAEAKALLRAQAELYWKNWVAGESLDLPATYKEHERLFSPESVALVEDVRRQAADPAEAKALTYLKDYLVGEIVAREVSALSDQIANIVGSATLSVDGRELPYRDLDTLLGGESNAERRQRISHAALPVLQRLGPLVDEREKRSAAVIASLQYPSYLALSAELTGLNELAIGHLADEVLSATETRYRELLATVARRDLGIADLAALRRADFDRLLRGPGTQKLSPDAMLPALEGLLAGMGLDLKLHPNFKIDASPSPKRNPRAFCIGLSVPEDVRLSVRPSGSAWEWAQLFHEAGHALGMAMQTTHAFEFQYLGPSHVSEAVALLLESVAYEPELLVAQGTKPERAAAQAQLAALRTLFEARRDAGLVIYDIARKTGLAGDPREAYRRAMEKAYGVAFDDGDSQEYLAEREDFTVPFDRLSARILAAELRRHLGARTEKRFWQDPTAGQRLGALLAGGSGVSAAELSRSLGSEQLDPSALVQHALGLWAGSTP